MSKYAFGVDIGGTTVKLGLFDKEANVLRKWEVITSKECGGMKILPDVAESILNVMAEMKIAKEDVIGVGVGVPGPVDAKGTINKAVNLGWGVFNIPEVLEGLLGVPVKAGNDANVAAVGEMWQGGGKGYQDLVVVTLGTGIGGGIAKNGELLSESASFEPGHKKYVYKKQTAEWEDLASAKVISETFNDTPVKNLKHNKSARREISLRLSLGLPDILLEENPDVIIVGGAVGFIIKKCKKLLLPVLKIALEAKITHSNASKREKTSLNASEILNRLDSLKIAPARRPLESVIYGGYLYAKRNR